MAAKYKPIALVTAHEPPSNSHFSPFICPNNAVLWATHNNQKYIQTTAPIM
ncbi:hypothetical protein [Pseudomonas sp. H9]|uniref:hypothetical protein n=1 Tax=Pseudomonas sp. H9 TaxID=483968 RepID=UPI0014046A8C|nr:hypothetical protein [Pseudomonas sp. H9]